LWGLRGMKIQVRTREVELSEGVRAHLDRRLGLALGRFGERIGKVSVRFTNADARTGGADKRCRIDVSLQPRTVTVEDADVDLFIAVDRAADRVSRSVARACEWESSTSPPAGSPGIVRR
jgi:putative sigma-54 modulation protein